MGRVRGNGTGQFFVLKFEYFEPSSSGMYSPAQVAALLCFMCEQLQEERVLEIVMSGLRIEFQLNYLHPLCNDQTMSIFFHGTRDHTVYYHYYFLYVPNL